MTTRKQSVAFPEVAIIRKGGPKINKTRPDGNSYQTVGSDLQDKFRVVFSTGCEDLSKRFQSIYTTDQPKIIRAMVPFPSVWKAWDHYNEAYNAGRLIARADDDKFLVYRDPTTGEYEVRDGDPYKQFRPGMSIGYVNGKGKTVELKMKAAGRLRLWLPELERLVFITLKTTSYYDCQNISANLAAVQTIADALNGGNAAGIPLILYRKEQEICWNKPDGSAQRVKKWLVQIEVDSAFVKAAFKRMSQFALTGSQPQGFLTPGEIAGTEDPDLLDEDDDFVEGGVEETPGENPPATAPETAVRAPIATPADAAAQPEPARTAIPAAAGSMTLETAHTVKNSVGTFYKDISPENLREMIRIMKAIPKPGDEIKFKISAADIILKDKEGKSK